MVNMLEVNNLSKKFPRFTLDNISFSLPQGHVMGFIGPNGSGKTTTMKLILNMLHKDNGTIKIMGLDNVTEESRVKEDLGVVFDSHSFCEEWSVAETGAIIGRFYEKWDMDRYTELLEKFNIDKKKKIRVLSRGQQMKLMLACALSHDAKLLILDEPTSGLDPIARDELINIISEYILDGTRSVLFSTHITDDLEKIADYITFIQDGEMIFTGLKDEFKDDFRKVTGGLEEITNNQKKKVIGYSELSTRFQGMIQSYNFTDFSGLQLEPISINDIMVFFNKEANICE